MSRLNEGHESSESFEDTVSSSDFSLNRSARQEVNLDSRSGSASSEGSSSQATGGSSSGSHEPHQIEHTDKSKNAAQFVPNVKRVLPKGFGKKMLPKRMPPPMIKQTDISRPSGTTNDITRRELELAKLKSTLMESRAAIGKRWQEAWRNSESNFSSQLSNGDVCDTSGDSSSFAELKSFRLSSEELPHDVPMDKSFRAKRSTRSFASSVNSFSEFFGRDTSSDSADAEQRSINLTSSDLFTNVSVEPPHDVGFVRSATFQTENDIPRPFQGLKVKLFSGDEQESESSVVSSNLGGVESKRDPEKELGIGASGLECHHDITGSNSEVVEESSVLVDAGKCDGEDMHPERTGESLRETTEYTDGDGVDSNPIRRLVKGPKQLLWTKTRKGDMEVDERLEEMASTWDFERRELADSLEFESDKHLTSNIEKLRRERLMLAHWAKKLNDSGTAGIKKGYRPPLMRSVQRNIGALFKSKESIPPLTSELSPRGGGIKERLGERALLPSTRVWQLEQQKSRLQQKTLQQSRELEVLQAAVRCKDTDVSQKDGSESTRDNGGDLSPRTAEVMVYEEQCSFLKRKADEQGEYSEAYREQLKRLTLKHFALRRRHGDACEAIRELKESERQHTLKTTEAFDQIEDLKMLAAKEENKRIIEMSCRQQLEHQALSLQDRYEQLLHYLQELEEKRSAYEDAMRVALSNCQKAEAMLQIREEEAAYAKHYMEKQDAQMLEKEVLRRKECDRANTAEKKVEDLKQRLLDTEREIEIWKAKQKETEQTFEQEQRAHAESQNIIEAKDSAIQQKEKELNILRLEMSEAKKLESNLRRRAHLLDKLMGEFDTITKAASEHETDLNSWRQALESKWRKLANILDEANSVVIKISTGAVEHPSEQEALKTHLSGLKSELSSQVDTLRLARSQELEMHKQETAALESECKRLSEALNTAETHRKTLEDALRMTEKHARIEELKNKSALARIAQNANAQGRSGLDPIVRELKVVFAGTVVEILSGKDHLPEPKFMKIVDGTILCWTDDLSGAKGFSRKHGIDVKNIIGVDFGPSSTAFRWGVELSDKKAKAPRRHLPSSWRCFTIKTLKDNYDIRARSDYEAEAWVVALGRLCGSQAGPVIKCRSEFIVRQVRLKLNAYAKQRGISLSVVWKEAILRTVAQLPQLRNMASKSRQRESTISAMEQTDAGKKRSSKHHRRHSDSVPSKVEVDDVVQVASAEGTGHEEGQGGSLSRDSARSQRVTDISQANVPGEHGGTAQASRQRRSRHRSVDRSVTKDASSRLHDTASAKTQKQQISAVAHDDQERKGERRKHKLVNKSGHQKRDLLGVTVSDENKVTKHHSEKVDTGKRLQTYDANAEERDMDPSSYTRRGNDVSKLTKKNSIKKMLIKASTILRRATTKNS